MWKREKPTKPGIYQVKGFNLFRAPSKQTVATVVVLHHMGKLKCNLHCETSDEDKSAFPWMDDMNDDFLWQGPFELKES